MGKPQNNERDPGTDFSEQPGGHGQSMPVRQTAGTCSEEPEETGWSEAVPPQDAASYIHDMALELKRLAESAKLSFLAYLLHLVVEESAAQKRGRL